MATDKEASYSCASDPNFAVICSFLDKFATQCGIAYPSFADLQEMLEDTQQVSQVLVDLHIKLLRKARKSFTVDKWEKALAKFCHTYSQQDGWELERFGYKKARLEVKVKLLKVLLETQFDVNSKFKSEVNRLTPNELRIEPLGKDQTGLTYWCQFDPSANVRVYREDADDETWELVAKDRDGLVQLIDSLSSGEGQQELDNILNEDSNSQEIEKPITDTGQDGSESEEDEDSVQEEDEEEEEEEEEEDEDDDEASVEGDEKTKHEKDLESLPRNNEADHVKPKEHLSKNDKRSTTEEDGNKANFVAKNLVVEGGATKHLVDETAEGKELNKEKSELTSSNGIENHLNGTNHDSKTQSLENGVSSSSETVNSNSSGADLSLKRETWHTTRPNSVYFMMPDRDPDPETANILSEMSIRFNEKSLPEDSEDLSKKKIKLDQNSKRKISSQSPEQSDKPISLSKKLKTDLPCSNDLPNASTKSPEEEDEEESADDESEVGEAIEEPVGYVVGPGNGAECEGGNIRECEQKHASDSRNDTDPNLGKEETPPVEVSEAIEEPVLYITGLGSGAECNVGNPKKVQDKELSKDSIVGSTIEEPLRYVQGHGTGIECEVGSPRRSRNPSNLSTLGVECSLENMSFEEFQPHFSEVIEEPVMIVQGSGHGYECSTGNPDEENNSVVQDPLTKVNNSQDLQNLPDKPKTEINCTDSTSIKKLTEEVVDQNVSCDRSSLSDPQASESENLINQKSTKNLEITVPSNDKKKSEVFDENEVEDSKQLTDGKKVKANGISGESSTNEVQSDDNLSTKNENEPESSDKKGAGRKNVMLTNIIEVCLDKANANGNDTSAKYNDLFSAKDLQTPPNKKDIVNKSPKPDVKEETSKKYKQDSAECIGESKVTTTKPFDDIQKGKNDVEQKNERRPSEENSDADVPCEKKLDSGDKHDIDNLNANAHEKSNKENIGATDESKKEPSVKTDEPHEEKLKSEDENCDKKSNFKEEKGEEISETKHTGINLKGRKSRTNSTNDDIKEDIPVKKSKTEQITKEPAKRSSKRNSRSTSSSTEETKKPSKPKKVSKEPANVSRLDKSKNEVEDVVKEKIKVDKSKNEAVVEVKEDTSKNKAEDEIKEESKVDKSSKNEKEDVRKGDIEVNKSSKNEAEDEDEEEADKKTANLACFSIDAEFTEGPVLGKPPEFKNVNRKRRSSMRMSKSEEDTAETHEEDEAGGKKPRLKGKVKKPKGKLAASKPAEECSSSEEDNKEETPIGKRKSNAKAPKKENTNSKTTKESNSKKAPAPKSSRLKSPAKGKSGDESSKESNKKKQQKKVEPAAKKPASSPRKAVLTPRKTAPRSCSQKKAKTPAKKKGKGKAKNKKSSSQTTPKKRKSVEDKKEDSEKEESEAEDEKDDEQKVDSDSKEEQNDENVGDSKEKSDEEDKNDKDEKVDDETQDQKPVTKKPRQRKPGNKKTTLLGLTEWDLYHSKKAEEAVATAAEVSESGRGLRASRRIAQNKIKEQAERRVLEDATIASYKDHKKKKKEEAKYESPKKSKKRKGKIDKASEEEDEYKEPKDEKGRKRKKRKDQLKFNENRPWQSSSGSSSEEADEEEDHFDMEEDEEDIRKKKIVSDHEFSPESDIEDEDEEYQPVKRARTAKKDTVKEEEKDEVSEDYPCQKCGKPDHPEWILLCDKCDNGYHASCLRPPLMLIPEGDWFCPPCQHADLVLKLRETLRTFERNTKKRENEELRRKRLAYVGISLANVLPTPEKNAGKTHKRQIVSSSEEESESEEESSSSDDEPVYQLRQRRATTQANYRFNDYDDLINSAIQDDMETGQGTGTESRGKDMQNIVDAEKKREEEEMEKSSAKDKSGSEKEEEESEEEQGENWRPRVVPRVTALPTLRKKHKKLTDLDNVSDDDSDEDFKGSSDDEDFSSSGGDSEDSIAIVPVRRSERARQSRIDKDFINDSDSSDEPRKKKTRRLFASSSSESSEGWGRKKKKPKSFSRIRSSRAKKKNKYFDSDSDRPKKSKSKRPKVKYGLSEDEDDMPKTRTRGKKVSYKQLQGTDSEEEMRRRHRKISSEDEDDEEFVPDKDEEEEDKNPSEKEDSGSQEEESEEESSEDEKQIGKKEQPPKKENDAKTPSQEVLPKTMEPEEATASSVKITSEPTPGSAIKKPASPSKGALNASDCDDEVEEEEIEEEIEEEVEEEEEEEIEEDEPPKKSAEQPPQPPKEAAVPKLRVVSPSELMGKKLSTNPEVPPMMPPNQISLSAPSSQGPVVLPGPSNLQSLNSGPQRAGPHNPSPMARTQMGIGRQQASLAQGYAYPPVTAANLPYDPLARHPYPSGQYGPNRPPPNYPQGHPRLPGPQSGHVYGQPPMPRYPSMPTSAAGHAIPPTNVPAHLQRPPGHYQHPPEGRTPHYGPPGGHPRAPSTMLRLPPQISVSVTGHPQPAVSSAGGHNQAPSSSSSQHGYPIARHSLPPVSAPAGPNHIAMAAVRPPVTAPGYGPQASVSGPPKQIPSRPHMPGPQPSISAPGYPQNPMSTMSHAQPVGSYPPAVGHHQPPHSTSNQPQTSSAPHHPSQTSPSMYPQPPASVESTSKAQLTSPEVSQQSKLPPGSSQSTTTAPTHPQLTVSTTSQSQVTPGHPQPPTPGHNTQSAGPSSNQNQTPESTTSNTASAPDEKPNIPINKPPQQPVSTSGQPQPPVGSTQTQSDNAQSSSESNKSPDKTVSSSTPSVEVTQKSETEEQKVNVKEEIEGEKKEQVPAIRLVSTAKLLDPSKAGRQRLVSPEEGMMRSGGMHGPPGGGPFYRPPPRLPPPPPGPPGPGYGRQRYPDHRTFPIYQHQPGLPPSSHGYYPQPGYYPSPTPPEDYRPPGHPSGSNYEEPEQGPTAQPAQGQGEPGNENEGGVFGGLVSYFSSQREDDIDS